MSQEVLSQTGRIVASMDQASVLADKHLKQLLACKPILACILQETVEECKDMSLEQIEGSIEGTPLVEKVPLYPENELLSGMSQEDFSEGEGTVVYDIRTNLMLPGKEKNEYVRILVNVEAQKEDKPGYDMPLRALFYCGRMISSQLGTEFSNQTDDPVKYGNIKKVYSIFICSNTAEIRANSVDRYRVNRETIIGHNDDEPRYDVLSAVIVNVGKKHDPKDTDSRMLRMLNDLLNPNMDTKQKLEALKGYGIAVSRTIEEEVSNMTAYTFGVMQEGLTRGRKEGRKEGRNDIIEQLLISGMSAEQIAGAAKIPIEEVQKIEAEMLQTV